MTVIYPIVAHNGYSAAGNLEPADAASPRAEGWMKDASPKSARPIKLVNANQLTSLSAMISYLAIQSGQTEFRIERRLSDRFGVPNAKCLPSRQFDSALRYLVDALSA